MFSALALLASLLGLWSPALAADSGILKVRSSVEAEVYVDGTLLGKTPLTKYLAIGPHKLRVVADQFDPFVRKIDIALDKTADVQATLIPGLGTLEFSGPPGSRLFLDGTERGPLPMRLPAPAAGAHAWRVEAPKCEPSEGTVDFVVGRNFLIDVKLASSRGVFVVVSTPPGASVVLDGKAVGVTPLRLTDVEPGKHTVLLQSGTLAAVFRTVDTSDGSRGEITATLPQGGGSIDLTTGSADATIYVEGTPVASGARALLGPYEKARLRVEVRIGERVIVDTIAVPSRGSLSLRVSGDLLVARKPLTQRWGFWAAVGGVAVVGGATSVAIGVASAPEPAAVGDTVVVLP